MKRTLLNLARKVRAVNTFLSIVTAWILLAMTCIVFYATLMRYGFDKPPIWTNETSTFLLLFVTFVPLGFVMQHDRHMIIDLVIDRMSKETRRVVNICNAFMAAGLFALLAWQGVRLAKMAFSYQWVSMEMNIPLGYPYLLVPIGSIVMVLTCLSKVIDGLWPEDTEQKQG
ncbi:MAG: TRAP transporter small permease [Desulfomonilaceae bacterium]|nr:TRAP transporter small permease [Desulfomonilaceae bacterium]